MAEPGDGKGDKPDGSKTLAERFSERAKNFKAKFKKRAEAFFDLLKR